MKYGICTGPDNLGTVKDAGFDYVEFSLNQIAGWTDAEFEAVQEKVSASGIAVEACNGFFPWEYRLTGPELVPEKVSAYAEAALSRASLLGVRVVVVGNGGARRIPEGFPLEKAQQQFEDVLRRVGDVAGKYNIMAALEPLNKRETNFLLSLSEGADMVRRVNHPHVCLLADFYHMRMDGEPMTAVDGAKGMLGHVHIANSQGRVYPLHREEDTFEAFFQALIRIGYDARISIEAGTENMAADGATALAMMRTLEQSLRA